MPAIVLVDTWNDSPLGELVDHIVATYHRPLPRTIDRLQAQARRAFGSPLDDRFDELRDLLVEHMQREEALVFPWLRRRDPGGVGILVTLLEHEHGDAAHRVRELGELVGSAAGVRPRAARALAAGLRVLAAELGEHVHLESRVLFPRALAAAAALD